MKNKLLRYFFVIIGLMLAVFIFWTQVFPQFYCTFLITHGSREQTYESIYENYQTKEYLGHGNRIFVIVRKRLKFLTYNTEFFVVSNINHSSDLYHFADYEVKRVFGSRKTNQQYIDEGKIERMTISKMIDEFRYNVISEYNYYNLR